VITLADGTYTCSSCVPELKVKADGTEQKVTGHPYYDTVAVTVLSPTSVHIIEKKAGKPVFDITDSVSADGKTLTTKLVDHTGAKAANVSFTAARAAAGPAGAHAVSGSWQAGPLTSADDSASTFHYGMTADGFSMQWNGQRYAAKFDGKEYPVVGDPGHTRVKLRKIDDNNVEETDYRMGKVTDEIHLAAAKDGKTLEVTDKDVEHGQTTSWSLDKQP
jgi:cytochrome c1